jgi:hypothetical protein
MPKHFRIPHDELTKPEQGDHSDGDPTSSLDQVGDPVDSEVSVATRRNYCQACLISRGVRVVPTQPSEPPRQ